MCTFAVSGEHKAIIWLSLGAEEGRKYIMDTLIAHYDHALAECSRRKGKQYTTISKTIKNPKIRYPMYMTAYCRIDAKNVLIPEYIYLKVKDVHQENLHFSLKTYLDSQVEKYILGE